MDVPIARKIAVRQFVFRHARRDQLSIKEIASSSTVREMFEIRTLARSGRFQDINPFSWFSKQVQSFQTYFCERSCFRASIL